MNKKTDGDGKFEAILRKIAIGLTIATIIVVSFGMLGIMDLTLSSRIAVCMLALVTAINGYNLFPRNKFSAVLLYGCSLLLVGWLFMGLLA
jgi:hypothetical protein